MKTSNFFWIMLIVISSCSKDPAEVVEIPIMPVSANEEITAFFEEHLPSPALSQSDCFFIDNDEDTYYLVNSLEQFLQLASCSDLPEIDFSSYSLIIGQKTVPNSFYSITEQKIVESSTRLDLYIVLYLGESVYPSFSTLYYWGIYPKLPTKKELYVNFKF